MMKANKIKAAAAFYRQSTPGMLLIFRIGSYYTLWGEDAEFLVSLSKYCSDMNIPEVNCVVLNDGSEADGLLFEGESAQELIRRLNEARIGVRVIAYRDTDTGAYTSNVERL